MGGHTEWVHPSECVFQKSQGIASDFYVIQTHESSPHRHPWLIFIKNHHEIVGNHSQRLKITAECERNTFESYDIQLF